MADYFSFEDVMKELELGEEELKRMVSEGELRAFRDENKMKFKKEDVDSLKKGRITEPTIILPSTPGPEITDETVLDLDIGHETEALSDVALPAVGAGKKEDDLLIETQEVSVEGEETFIEEESETGASTEPLKLADEVTEDTVETEAVTEEVPPVSAAPVKRAKPRPARRAQEVPVAVEEEIERKRAHPIWTFFVLLTFVATLYGGLFFYDMMRMEAGKSDQPSSLTAGTAEWMLKKFWEDKNWTKFHERKYPEGGVKKPPFEDPQNQNVRLSEPYDGPTFRPHPEKPGETGAAR